MNIKKFICIIFLIPLTGCVAQQQYYKNTRYTGDIQGHMNRDLQYCDAIARGARPAVAPYIPPSPQTSYGHGTVVDNQGNVYTGTYQQTTYPNENHALVGGMDSLSRSIQASNVYIAIKNKCLSELGWYQISKEDYLISQSTQQTENNKQLEQQKNEAARLFAEMFKRDHPDYYNLSLEKRKMVNEDIQKWVETLPYKEADPLMKIVVSGNPDEVSFLMTTYKKRNNIQMFNK